MRNRRRVPGLGIVFGFFNGLNMVGLLWWVGFVLMTWTIFIKLNYPLRDAFNAALFWGSISYALIIGTTCWYFIRSNWAAMFQNVFCRRPMPVNDVEATNTLKVPVGQYGVLEGLHFIPFWYRKLRPNGDIDISTGDSLKFTAHIQDVNGLDGTVKVNSNLTPASGPWLANYLRVPSEIAKPYLQDKITAGVQAYYKTRPDIGDEIANLPEANAWAERELLNGSNRMSDPEKRTGRFAGEIVLSDLEWSETTKEIIQAKRKAEAIVKAAIELQKIPGLAPAAVASMAAEIAGVDVNIAQAVIQNIGQQPNEYLDAQIAARELVQAMPHQPHHTP